MISEARNAYVGLTTRSTVHHIVRERGDFGSRAAIVLLAEVDFHWSEFITDGVDPLWTYPR